MSWRRSVGRAPTRRQSLVRVFLWLEGERDQPPPSETVLKVATLSKREKEVFALLSHGMTSFQVARRLGCKERTVSSHIARVYGKLGVHSRGDACAVFAAKA